MPDSKAPEIEVSDLTYRFPGYATGLSGVTLSLPPGSRTLLIGANGAGKTTLLRLLAGKRLAPAGSIRVAGADPFKDGLEGVTYLGLECKFTRSYCLPPLSCFRSTFLCL